MKSFSKPSLPQSFRSRKHNAGVALIIVLGMLTLIVVLMVAFISSVSTELQSAKSYANGQDAKTLADSTVNIVISQIQDSTSNPRLAWASQPGMVRTYDNTGAASASYKLYSSDELRVTGNFNPISGLATEIPDDWASLPGEFTDLNKPVAVAGSNRFPIIPSSAVAAGAGALVSMDGASTPIEGCYLDTASTAPKVTSVQSNPVPMPVRWMYVLKDGKIAPINRLTKKVDSATKDNPIVGRMAFWTDDETCKVNINTASEGTFWDRPWTDGTKDSSSDPNAGFEQKLSARIPVQNEFQRFPGHPATTSLSTIFPPPANEIYATTGEPKPIYKQRIYGITPRVTEGGSQSATVDVTLTTATIVPDTDRLFSSVDEFMFQPGSTATRPQNAKGTGTLKFTDSDLEKVRFFLTANSRSPEVNMFNKPRITLWPLQANTADVSNPTANTTSRNAKDKLIAFCSTIGNKPYYFQRFNVYTSTTQNPIPSSQSPSLDWTSIPRNQALFTYLQSLTSAPIPGLGGSLSGSGGKYTVSTRDQILTEMMDFVRSGLNTFRTKASAAATADAPYYNYVPFGVNASQVASGWAIGQSQVVPLVIQPPGATYKTKGFGRFSTVTQAAVIFFRTDKLMYVPEPNPAPAEVPKELPSDATEMPPLTDIRVLDGSVAADRLLYPMLAPATMRGVIILQTFNPTPGAPPWSGNARYQIEGLNSFSTNAGPLGFPATVTNLVNGQEGYYDATALTGLENCTQYFGGGAKSLGSTTVGASDEQTFYPFGSSTVTLTSNTFNFTGGTIKIKIFPGFGTDVADTNLVQTLTMNFPPFNNMPIPSVNYSVGNTLNADKTPKVPASKTVGSNNMWTDYDVRLAFREVPIKGGRGVSDGGGHNPLPYIIGGYFPDYKGDVVRSVQARAKGPALGDYRIIDGLADVSDDFFEGHGMKDTPPTDGLKYSDTAINTKMMHSLRVYVSVGNEQTGKSNGFYNNANNFTGMTYNGTNPTPEGKSGHARLVNTAAVLDGLASGGVRPNRAPVAPQGLMGAYMDAAKNIPGDWDNGPGTQIDGPYVNRPDEGNSNIGYYNTGGNTTGGAIVETGASYSPNRQIASAVAFGSLPTGIDPDDISKTKPWRTLLFGKHPAAGSLHPGFGVPADPTVKGPPYNIPPDHAFLDFFTMPIVEPYAISEPFSTAGKVNMNYQIVPFTYLTRDTGVRAVMKSTRVMAIPTADGRNYKSGPSPSLNDITPPLTMPPDYRYTLNLSETTGTLAGFEQRFTRGDIFRSASEICDISLVPDKKVDGTVVSGSPTYATMETWWETYKLTGDNVRESPYGNIYPRLTTKSNTYTVHVQTQSLKKLPGTTADVFDETKDQITGEFRGSFVIERYLIPGTDSLVKADGTATTETDPDGMVGPYKFRILSSKRFAP